jgi:Queuosine biosynthesis protein QueC
MKNKNNQSGNYTFRFDSIMNNGGNIRFFDNSRKQEIAIGVAIDDSEFRYRVQQDFPSIIADLIDLAVAIHASDRLAFQDSRQEQTCIHVVLPVRHPELLCTTSFHERLSSLLEWVTGSKWLFDFHKRLDSGRSIEQQPLISSDIPHVDEVTLWSGGLDALAGLYTRLQANRSRSFMLFGTGSNDNVYARQEQVFQGLLPSFSNRLNLCRVPIRLSASKSHRKNNIPRARGVVFMLLGSACAYLMGRKSLHLYENGIGAINLPYRKSSVGLDHSRSVHPLTLLQTSGIISEILGEEFQIKNPFLFWTKAEMCQSLTENRRINLIPLTKSCDRPHRRKPIQCGYCSSCILRRQALMAVPIEDETRYIVPHVKRPTADNRLYLQHMITQISTLRELLDNTQPSNIQWESLIRRFPELEDIVDRTAGIENQSLTSMQKNLILLYQTYVSEWDFVTSSISGDLLSTRHASDDCLVTAH